MGKCLHLARDDLCNVVYRARYPVTQKAATMGTAEIIKRAIRAGHSHTVIGFCDDLTISQREELKQCAELADCQCLVLTQS